MLITGAVVETTGPEGDEGIIVSVEEVGVEVIIGPASDDVTILDVVDVLIEGPIVETTGPDGEDEGTAVVEEITGLGVDEIISGTPVVVGPASDDVTILVVVVVITEPVVEIIGPNVVEGGRAVEEMAGPDVEETIIPGTVVFTGSGLEVEVDAAIVVVEIITSGVVV